MTDRGSGQGIASHTQAPSSSAPKWRLAAFTLLFVALTALGLYTVYSQFAGKTLTFDDRLLSPLAITSLTGLLSIYFLADGLRLHYTLRALGYRLPAPAMAKLVFINLFFSNVTPMATGGGVAQVVYMQRHGIPLGRATAATTIRTVLAIAFIFTLSPLFLLTLDALQGREVLSDISNALVVFVVLYLAFFAVVLFRTRWLIGPLAGLLALLRRFHLISEQRYRRWHFRTRREMVRFARSFGAFLRGDKRWVLLSILFTAVFLLCLFSFPALLIYLLGYDVPYWTSFGLLVVTTFIMYFAPTPGASGISEGVFGSFFRDILTGNHLVLVTVAWRFLTIYLGMLIGLVLLQRDLTRPTTDNE